MTTLTSSLLALAALLQAPASAQARNSPFVENVLVVLWDDVGWDDVAADVPTPTLDALRSVGVTLDRFYVQPVCSPTRASLLYGQYGFRTGIGRPILHTSSNGFTPPVEQPSLAGLLKNHGIRTGLIGKWHLSNQRRGVSDEGARVQGFGNWQAGAVGNFRTGEDYGASPTGLGWNRVDDGVATRETSYATTAQTDAAILWWEENQAERKFLLVAYNAAHEPYEDPPFFLVPNPSRKGGNRAVFEDMVQALDLETGRLLDSIDLRDTIVLVLSDNGTPPAVADTDQEPGKLKNTAFEGGIRVPCVIAGRGVPRRKTVSSLVHVVDIHATICEVMGVAVPPGQAEDSLSFVPVVQHGTPIRSHVYSQVFRPNGFGNRTHDERAVVGERFKLHWVNGLESLYDLQLDPTESNPLDLSDPAIQGELTTLRTVLLDLEG